MATQHKPRTSPVHASASTAFFRLRALHLLLVLAGMLTPILPTSALAVVAAPQAPQLMLAKVYHPAYLRARLLGQRKIRRRARLLGW
jgi:hypothetical protein